MSWQRDNVQAAANYLRERIGAGDNTPRTRTIHEGLLEVLDPNRRTTRLQRENLTAAKAAALLDGRPAPEVGDIHRIALPVLTGERVARQAGYRSLRYKRAPPPSATS